MKQTFVHIFTQGLLVAFTFTFVVTAGTAHARPQLGSQCSACHERSAAPVTATPAEPAPDTRVPPLWEAPQQELADESSSAPAPVPAPKVPQAQIVQPSSVAPTESTPAVAPPLQQHANTGHSTHQDPLSFRLTFGFLSSSDIEQHRSNSIFHGSSKASFSQPGAEGSGHSEDTDAEAGNRLHFGALANYQSAVSNKTSLIYGARVFRDDFIDEDFNRLNARLSLGLRQRYDGQMVRLTTYLQQTTFDGDAEDLNTDFAALGIKVDYQRDLANGNRLLATLHARQRDYAGEDDPRKAEFSSALGIASFAPERGGIEYGLGFLTRNNPKKEHNRYDSPSIYASWTRPITATTTLGISGEFGGRWYKATDPDEDEARVDSFAEVGFSLADTRLNVLSATPRFSCAYNQTASNIARFDSHASYCALMLETRF